jgi:hypothetical protein
VSVTQFYTHPGSVTSMVMPPHALLSTKSGGRVFLLIEDAIVIRMGVASSPRTIWDRMEMIDVLEWL